MICVFIQIRCVPGTTYDVADKIALKEMHSEQFINDNLLDIANIERTLTTMTFKTF